MTDQSELAFLLKPLEKATGKQGLDALAAHLLEHAALVERTKRLEGELEAERAMRKARHDDDNRREAEVKAMRQRVGDLECLFRWAREIQRDSKSWIFSRSEVVRQDLSVLHPDRYAHKMMVLESDSTGLPLLTDEARKALRGRE